MKKMSGSQGWLKASYATHGNTTDSTSKGNRKNMDDTPKSKVAAAGRKNTEADPTKFGNKSGGGKSSQRTTSAGNGGNAKYTSGIVGSRKQ